jgi:hypothetical protein
MSQPIAVVHLRGHGSTPADLEVTRYSPVAWIGRILRYVVAWLVVSALTLVITFDPFVASFPFVIGGGYVYHTIRGRFHVHRFSGKCPRCSNGLELKRGSKIPLPYPLNCFNCHHEPELRLTGAGPAGSVPIG